MQEKTRKFFKHEMEKKVSPFHFAEEAYLKIPSTLWICHLLLI
jgi:hypothetical protein